MYNSSRDILVSLKGKGISDKLKIFDYFDPILATELDFTPQLKKNKNVIRLKETYYKEKHINKILKALDYPNQKIFVVIPKVEAPLRVYSDEEIEFTIAPYVILNEENFWKK